MMRTMFGVVSSCSLVPAGERRALAAPLAVVGLRWRALFALGIVTLLIATLFISTLFNAPLLAPALGQGPPPSVLVPPENSVATPAATPPAETPAADEQAPEKPLDKPLKLERLPIVPEWYHADYWLPPEVWSGSFELGINGSEGNASTFSMRVGGTLKRKTDWDQLDIKFTHAKTDSEGVITQNNALLNMRDEWPLGDRWTGFVATNLEYDEFKAFDLRLVMNGGLGYKWLDSDDLKLKTRVGAGTSREFGGPQDDWVPEGLLGIEYERKISQRQKLTVCCEYFPDWQDFSDFRLVTNIGWELLVDEFSNMRLKVGVIDRYDSTPNGRRPNDLDYSIMLMWKL